MTASIIWDSTVGSYRVSFNASRYDWKKPYGMAWVLKEALKAMIPVSDRDYDDTTHTWYVAERWYAILTQIFESNIGKANLSAAPKPENAPKTTFVPVEQDLDVFARIIGMSINDAKALDFGEATKKYRRAALALHPDRNPQGAEEMSKLNEVWARLKTKNVFTQPVGA